MSYMNISWSVTGGVSLSVSKSKLLYSSLMLLLRYYSRTSAVQLGLFNPVVVACKAEVNYVLRIEQTTQQFPRQTER